MARACSLARYHGKPPPGVLRQTDAMIFRQLFDSDSSTYTYLLASRRGAEALIIDPVLDRVDRYIQLLDELELKLVKAVDTHVHADHVTGLGALRDRTRCITVMGKQSGVDVVSVRVEDGDHIGIEGLSLEVVYTPGHTDDSYCFLMGDRVFTGDTLLIRGTGRTDFQHGNPVDSYNSIFSRLLTLPDETLVYPGHDYKGDTVSTIWEEKNYNPRLQVASVGEYVEIMDNLNLPNPKLMDVAVPANLKMGLAQDEVALSAPHTDAALRRVLDRCLDGVADLLAVAQPLPERLGSLGLAMESGAIRRLAVKLAARPKRRDPLAERVAARGWSVSCEDARELMGRADIVLIDLRDKNERQRHGVIAGSVHAPYPDLDSNLAPGGLLHELAASTGKRLVFYCASGERSAMAVQAAQEAGLTNSCHLTGGIDAWRTAGGTLEGAAA